MAQDAVGEQPRVRAITAFVRLDDVRHRQPIDEALAVLRAPKRNSKSAARGADAADGDATVGAISPASLRRPHSTTSNGSTIYRRKRNSCPMWGRPCCSTAMTPRACTCWDWHCPPAQHQRQRDCRRRRRYPLEDHSVDRAADSISGGQQPPQPGKFQFHRDRHAQALRTLLPGYVSHGSVPAIVHWL